MILQIGMAQNGIIALHQMCNAMGIIMPSFSNKGIAAIDIPKEASSEAYRMLYKSWEAGQFKHVKKIFKEKGPNTLEIKICGDQNVRRYVDNILKMLNYPKLTFREIGNGLAVASVFLDINDVNLAVKGMTNPLTYSMFVKGNVEKYRTLIEAFGFEFK